MILDTRILVDMAAHTGMDAAKELIDFFISEGRMMVDGLIATIAAGDLEASRRAAHSLKSSAGQFGALELQDAARLIEIDIVSSPAVVPALALTLRRAADEAFIALQQWKVGN
jgi:HPt (histidine-containing phosphotransfer) domain-containing protein